MFDAAARAGWLNKDDVRNHILFSSMLSDFTKLTQPGDVDDAGCSKCPPGSCRIRSRHGAKVQPAREGAIYLLQQSDSPPRHCTQGEDGKRFRTRSGDTVPLKALLSEAQSRCFESLSSRNSGLDPQQLQVWVVRTLYTQFVERAGAAFCLVPGC